jgi:hypothetical protein
MATSCWFDPGQGHQPSPQSGFGWQAIPRDSAAWVFAKHSPRTHLSLPRRGRVAREARRVGASVPMRLSPHPARARYRSARATLPETGRDSACVARACANIGFNFQTAGIAFSQRCAAPVLCKARGGPSVPALTNREGAERRKAHPCIHALRQACAARRGKACTHLAMRPPPGAPLAAFAGGPFPLGRHHQPRAAFLEPAFAPANAASSSQSAHSGARAESRDRPSARGTYPRPQGPRLAPSSKRP